MNQRHGSNATVYKSNGIIIGGQSNGISIGGQSNISTGVLPDKSSTAVMQSKFKTHEEMVHKRRMAMTCPNDSSVPSTVASTTTATSSSSPPPINYDDTYTQSHNSYHYYRLFDNTQLIQYPNVCAMFRAYATARASESFPTFSFTPGEEVVIMFLDEGNRAFDYNS